MEHSQIAPRPEVPDLGNHLMMDFIKIKEGIDLDNLEALDKQMRDIAKASSVELEDKLSKKMQPQGLNIVYLHPEGHFSIRTWP